MLTGLSANVATLVVCGILIAGIAAAIRVLIQNRKQGKHSCGGNCAACGRCSGTEYINIEKKQKK